MGDPGADRRAPRRGPPSDLRRNPRPQLQSELEEELGRGCEVVNHDADVIHPLDSHVFGGKGPGGQRRAVRIAAFSLDGWGLQVQAVEAASGRCPLTLLIVMKASLLAVAFVLAGCGGGWEGGKTPGIQTVVQIRAWPQGKDKRSASGNGGSTAIWQVERIQRPRRLASNSSTWPIPLRPPSRRRLYRDLRRPGRRRG